MAGAEERKRELQDELRRIAAAIAETAEQSARVRDDVADLHDELGSRSRLDPAALREQAERDRAFAADEREVAEGGATYRPRGPDRPDAPAAQ